MAADGSGGESAATSESAPVAAIQVTAESYSIYPDTTTTVQAAVYDESGNALSGVAVSFTLDDPLLAAITPLDTTSASGTASATFSARAQPGEVAVTATAGSLEATSPQKIIILDQSAPEAIQLSVSPDSIVVQGTATITAAVRDVNGDPVANGTSVVFEVENALYGSISSSALTNSGVATATFTAGAQPGTAVVQAASGAASAQAEIEILQAPAAAIEFVSAEPQQIAIKDTGGLETAAVQFIVKDSNGNPLSDINVAFQMDGPNGGEYIDSSGDATPDEIEVSTDADGIARILLHSGDAAGPVTIFASITVSGDTMTTQASLVSIGGGTASAKRFSASAEILNLPGLWYNNRTTEITAYLADRFGNYNILKGTTVSFAAEVGLAVDTSNVTLAEDGVATVTVRTQKPVDATIASPEDVAPLAWEVLLQAYLQETYGYTTTAHPRDGLCSVLIYTKGEEHFNDRNANGAYDAEEVFVDTYDEPFCDYNDNGVYDAGDMDPAELYFDIDGNGVWNEDKNAVWDASKTIFANFKLLVTGAPMLLMDASGFAVANGGTQTLRLIICDRNLNILTPGTQVTIAADVGALSGQTEREYINSNAIGWDMASHLGLIEYTVHLSDADGDEADPPENGTLTITVDWEGMPYEWQLAGSVD